ncbi:MAG: hypothetical protein WCQ72_01885 [Eubacteriales bacterium]
MIYPSIEELSQSGKYNRYTLVIATSKCARMVTDEYVAQREIAEKLLANKETDKTLASMIKREFRDEKAVKSAIKRLYQGEYKINDESLEPAYQAEKLKEREELEQAEKERREHNIKTEKVIDDRIDDDTTLDDDDAFPEADEPEDVENDDNDDNDDGEDGGKDVE